MKIASVMLRRTLRRWIVFMLLLAAPIVAVQISGTESIPPVGLYMPEGDPVSQRISQYLLENGFVLCDTPADMEELVKTGQLNCGAVFCEDFARKIAEGDVERCVRFYQSPSSYTPDLYKSHVAAAVFKEYVPYISAEAFAGTDITQEQVLAAYEAMFAEGYVFSFDVVLAEEGQEPEDVKARSLAMGVVAIVQCATIFGLCAETMGNSFRAMVGRLGLGRCIATVVLPEVLMHMLWTSIFGGVGLYLAGYPELIASFAVYSLLLGGVGLMVTTVFRQANRMYIALPIIVIASAALCPVYTDLSLLIPAVETIRCVLPVYWFWMIPDSPILWAVFGLAMMFAGIGVMILRYRLVEKYRFSQHMEPKV